MNWNRPADIAGLAFFRIGLGILLFLESVGAIFTGWVDKTFIDTSFTFHFIDFPFLQPLPGYGMYAFYALMGLAGLGIALGYRYRLASISFFLLWTASYFMQKTHYNNHYYLLVLLAIILIVFPFHRSASLDSKQGRVQQFEFVPIYYYWFLQALFCIIFFYAAKAKLNPDWLTGYPMGPWLASKSNFPIIGSLLTTTFTKWSVCYGGIIFDFLIGPLLLWRRTRPIAFVLSIFFNLFNSAVFLIGVFPYLMIFYGSLFFSPDWCKKWTGNNSGNSQSSVPRFSLIFLSLFLFVQVLLPLRHHLIPGDVNWTEEGHRMSWRMMLRAKTGTLFYIVRDKETGEEFKVLPKKEVSKDQYRAMCKLPDLIWQYAQRIEKRYAIEGREVQVFAKSSCSLNKRPRAPLVDPEVDLAAENWSPWKHHDWIYLEAPARKD